MIQREQCCSRHVTNISPRWSLLNSGLANITIYLHQDKHIQFLLCVSNYVLFIFVHFFYHNLLDQRERMRRDTCCLYSTCGQLTLNLLERKRSVVKYREVKWSEAMNFGEMCVLILIYNYVAVCRFCAVGYVIIFCFCLLFFNYLTMFFFFRFVFVLYFCFLFCCILWFCIVLCTVMCTVSPSVHSCIFLFLRKFTDHCHRVEIQLQ